MKRLLGPKAPSAFVALALCVLGTGAALARDVSLVFATATQGRAILTMRDDFVQRISPFDRSARMKTDRSVSEAEYLKFVGAQVLEWTDSDKAALQPALSYVRPRADALDLPWPDTIYLVKSTGNEEGNAPYTRANAIVLPRSELAKKPAPGTLGDLPGIVAHELFHILSRHNPALKEKLYAAIGFQPCGEVAFPSRLADRKITNPDAPKNDHCIRVAVDGKKVWVVPILFSNSAKYDPARGGEFFNYLQFQFLRVDGAGAQAPRHATYNDADVQLLDVNRLSGFFEQVGRNTGYIIHPEEILADNFSLLIRGQTNLPSPEIQRKIKAVLDQASGPIRH